MSDHTVAIGDTVFDHVSYDRDADVLYLSVGEPRGAHHTFGTPEGHAVRYCADEEIIGITIVNARALLERGELSVTVPRTVDLRRDEIAVAVA